ncbi:MAG: HAMP domain-containing histidine kinase [Planctomycetes bacterium]|nr:HAMP domain-containing histidine kinase [Planctomycetota bacterium]
MIAKSTQYATAVALAYGLVATIYIVVSSRLAAEHAASVEEMQRIETIKGIVYVLVTMLAVFVACGFALRRMAHDAHELLRRERVLVQSHGKVFAGVMAASVAHDANNVLTAVLGDLEMLAGGAEDDRELHLGQLRHSIGRLVALNRRLSGAARQGGPKERQLGDLARLVRDSIATVRAHRSLFGCSVVLRGEPSIPFETQPLLVHQVVTNLVLNAGEAAGNHGQVEVVARQDGEHVVIEVHDNGPGVPVERRAHLFDSLVSTKPDGSGLGLFSVRACVQGLGGEVAVGDSPLGGACFTVRLPRQLEAVPA